MKKLNFYKTALITAAALAFVSFFTGCNNNSKKNAIAVIATSTPVPHQEKIISTFNGNMYWMDTDGNNRQEIFPDANSKWFPAVSPDGFYIAYWVQNNKNYNIWIADLHKKTAYPVTFDEDTVDGDLQNFNFRNAPCFSADGQFIVYGRRGDIWKMTKDGYDQTAMTSTHNCLSPVLSKDNRLVFVMKENDDTCNLYIQDLNGRQPEKLTRQSGKKAGSPAFSPDGKKILYTVQDNDSINIFIIDTTDKNEDQLTFDGRSNAPSFSIDGSRIIYSSFLNNKYQPEIWEMNSDKTNKIKLTSAGGVSPVWLYQVLAEPLPTPTAAASPEAAKNTKQEAVFDVKETTSSAKSSIAPAQPTSAEPTVNPLLYPAAETAETLKVTTVQQGNKLLLYPVIHYDSSLSNIKPEFKPALDDMARILKSSKSPVIIEGHTDNVPIKTKKFPSNYELSLARANAVKYYLVKKDGIDPSRITVTGFGDTKPAVPNDSSANKYINRRSEVVVISVVSEPAKETAVKVINQTADRPAVQQAPKPVSITVAAPVSVSTAAASPSTITAATPGTAAPVKVQIKSGPSKSISW
ncbi:MAG: OmpA family protein [Candidatus Goldiibacteriota bacterium]|jgi:chemotaxis protein MotB